MKLYNALLILTIVGIIYVAVLIIITDKKSASICLKMNGIYSNGICYNKDAIIKIGNTH